MALYEKPNYSWNSFLNNTESNIDLQESNLIDKKKSLLPNSPLASNISKEGSIFKIPSYIDYFGTKNTTNNNKFQMYPKFNTGEVSLSSLKKPTDSYLKSRPIKPITIKKESWTRPIENNEIEADALKEVDKELGKLSFKTPSIIGLANIATGASSLINAGTSLYGAIQAGKMQPKTLKPYVPIEAKLVKDNSSAIQTAGQENIDKSIATNKADVNRKGIVGMNGVFVAKETEALNQLGSQLAQYRTGIETQNAQIENSVNAQNKQAEMQTEQFNASTENQYDQYKSGLIGMGMKNATDAITSGANSIFGNIIGAKQNEIASITNELSQINNLMQSPNFLTTGVPADVLDRKKQLEERLNSINKSIS